MCIIASDDEFAAADFFGQDLKPQRRMLTRRERERHDVSVFRRIFPTDCDAAVWLRSNGCAVARNGFGLIDGREYCQ